MPIYELLIQRGDNTNPNPVTDQACYKDGDVISIRPQGHRWTEAERKCVVRMDLTEVQKDDILKVEMEGASVTTDIPVVKVYHDTFPSEKHVFFDVPVKVADFTDNGLSMVTLRGNLQQTKIKRKHKLSIKPDPDSIKTVLYSDLTTKS